MPGHEVCFPITTAEKAEWIHFNFLHTIIVETLGS